MEEEHPKQPARKARGTNKRTKEVKEKDEPQLPEPEKLDYVPMEEEPKKVEVKDLKVAKNEPHNVEISPALRYEHMRSNMRDADSRPTKPVEVVPYPPAPTFKPLRKPIGSNEPGQEEKYKEQSRQVINFLTRAHSMDEKLFSEGQQAPYKLAALEQVKEKLTNVYTRSFFIKTGGLKVLAMYLSPIYDQNQEPREPCLATKLRVVRMLSEFRLQGEVMRGWPEVTRQVMRNRGSRVAELSDTCRQLIDSWEISSLSAYAKKRRAEERKRSRRK